MTHHNFGTLWINLSFPFFLSWNNNCPFSHDKMCFSAVVFTHYIVIPRRLVEQKWSNGPFFFYFQTYTEHSVVTEHVSSSRSRKWAGSADSPAAAFAGSHSATAAHHMGVLMHFAGRSSSTDKLHNLFQRILFIYFSKYICSGFQDCFPEFPNLDISERQSDQLYHKMCH